MLLQLDVLLSGPVPARDVDRMPHDRLAARGVAPGAFLGGGISDNCDVGVVAGAMTQEQIGVLTRACLVVLDDLRDRGELSDDDWTHRAELLSARAGAWLAAADNVGTDGAGVP